jgi:antitoxin component YwqK of YwqJK toxin-antitoxin module
MKKLILAPLFVIIASFGFSQSLDLIDGYFYKNGMIYTGTYTEFWPNNKTKMIQHIQNGLADGITELFFEDGKINEQRSYLEGQKHGDWYIYNEQGVKISEANYRHNKKNGIWHVWNDNGILLYEMYYSNGEKIGKWMIWDEKGNIIMERQY